MFKPDKNDLVRACLFDGVIPAGSLTPNRNREWYVIGYLFSVNRRFEFIINEWVILRTGNYYFYHSYDGSFEYFDAVLKLGIPTNMTKLSTVLGKALALDGKSWYQALHALHFPVEGMSLTKIHGGGWSLSKNDAQAWFQDICRVEEPLRDVSYQTLCDYYTREKEHNFIGLKWVGIETAIKQLYGSSTSDGASGGMSSSDVESWLVTKERARELEHER